MLAAHDGADFFGLFGVAFFVEILGDKLRAFEYVLNREAGVVLLVGEWQTDQLPMLSSGMLLLHSKHT